MPKEELQVEVKKLISLGKQKGYLTYEELNSTLPAEMVSSEQLSNLMTIFGEMVIEIVDGSEGERDQRKHADNEEVAEEGGEREELEEGEKEIDLTPGLLSRT
ncbi:MAG: RNA polymerase sigma factor region1.1 domain-containing protein, partial [Nitrospiraceae bacterium]